ncbi:hypothetical protein [Mycoplasma wenyonii]|nr:hypothetical protein [Mycoplasma wenyonii]
MSVLIKGFQIFSLAGTVASVPFIPSLKEQNETIPAVELTSGGA